MVNNLFQNAIRHNYKGGIIKICATKNHFSISNSGFKKVLDQKNCSNVSIRTMKLSIPSVWDYQIAKEIAEKSNLALEYAYKDNQQVFVVKQM